jgi:hypothetical protein
MGNGHEIWQVEGNEHAKVMAMENVSFVLEEVGKGSLDLAEGRKGFDEFSGDIQCGKFLE